MRRALVVIASSAAVLGALRLSSSCLEFTPIVVEKESGFDSGTTCLNCVEEVDGGCGAIVLTCEAVPLCGPIFACIAEANCFDRPTVDEKIKCGLPCAVDAGITNVDDEIVQSHLVPLIACAQTTCAASCNAGDASLGL